MSRRVVIDRSEAIYVIRPKRDSSAPQKFLCRHGEHIAGRVARWLGDPEIPTLGHIPESQGNSILVKVPAYREHASGDRRPALPRAFGVAWWQIIRVRTRRRHDIKVEWPDSDWLEPAVIGDVAESDADPYVGLRLG